MFHLVIDLLGFVLFMHQQIPSLNVAEPNCLLHWHDGPAYDVKFYGDGENSLLLSCGDDGRIRGLKWMDVMEAKQDGLSKGGDLKPQLDLANPQHKGFDVESSYIVGRYDINGAMLSQIQCVPQSTFSVSLHPSGVISVAGYDGVVDVTYNSIWKPLVFVPVSSL